MPSVYIKTYGCQMNERDSEAVAARFVAHGYALAPSESTADVILLNTCSVRDAAERKALGKMTNLVAETRRGRPGTLLGFLGCMAQSRAEELVRQPGVSLVLGTQKVHRAVEYVDQLRSGERLEICDVRAESGSEAHIRDHVARNGERASVKAFVSIMQGCNQHCTFCIVPRTRGRERSRAIEDIVDECHGLVRRGVKEVTLLGQIVTSYGRREIGERDGKSAFVRLLEAVNDVEGLERIRFTSPHPKGYGDDLAEAYGRLPKLCESAHLPLQSGSNRLLKLMHRGYTRERYLEIVARLRGVCPEIGLSTDIIVGFPGETEDDFRETLDLASRVEFDNAFVFKYSERKDTPAASMEPRVPVAVREERLGRLLDCINGIAVRKYRRMVGKRLQVLVEGPSRKNRSRLTGRTRCNKITVFEGPPRLAGGLLEIDIVRSSTVTLYGEPTAAESS